MILWLIYNLSCILCINSWINLSVSWQLFQVYFPNIICKRISLVLSHCIFSASKLFSEKFNKNSFQFKTKICEKFKFLINSICDENSNLFSESVICLVTLRPVVFSRLVTLYQYQSVTNTLEIDKGFSLLLYLQFFWKQPTGIVFELI